MRTLGRKEGLSAPGIDRSQVLESGFARTRTEQMAVLMLGVGWYDAYVLRAMWVAYEKLGF